MCRSAPAILCAMPKVKSHLCFCLGPKPITQHRFVKCCVWHTAKAIHECMGVIALANEVYCRPMTEFEGLRKRQCTIGLNMETC